jgi:hypothetical protein
MENKFKRRQKSILFWFIEKFWHWKIFKFVSSTLSLPLERLIIIKDDGK